MSAHDAHGAALEPGAVPLAPLSALDSAERRLSEQQKRDRVAQAERNRRFHEQIDRIEQATGANTSAIAGILASSKSIKWLLGIIAMLAPVCVGAAWALGRAIR